MHFEVLRSVFIAWCAAIGDYAVLIALVELAGVQPLGAATAAVVFGLTISLLGHTFWIFPGSDHGYHTTQTVLFVAIAVAGLMIHTGAMYVLSSAAVLHYLIDKTIAVTVMFTWGFLMRRIVHRILRKFRRAGNGRRQPSPVLRLECGGQTVYSSDGSWLHPLLNLTAFLSGRTIDTAGCVLHDKIVGRAAALLMVRLGIQSVQADVISRRAIPVFGAHGVAWQGDTVVDRIDCRTEDILADEHDPESAYRIIRERAAAAKDRTGTMF
ncbi:MAG: DUF1893 domain-containing protein [Spirochaetaceae bacterium]